MTSIHNQLFGATLLALNGLAFSATAPEAREAGGELTNPAWATSASHSADYSSTRQTLAKLIRQAMKQQPVMGLSIALIDDQRVIWSRGFGYADKAHGIKATPETLYRAGSISKLFTATAAMQLAEQGRLDIDQPIQTYVPQFSIKTRFPETAPITSRLLMTHHSGLPTDYLKGALTGEPFSEVVDKLPDEYTAYPPNFILSYSNLGIALLGHVIESACGKPFDACLQDRLLQPLGMTHSSFSTDASSSPLMSKAYRKGWETEELRLRDVPAGGLNSNVLDLSRFVRMVFAEGHADNQQLLASASLAEMLRPQNTDVALDLDQRIGLAWILEQTPTGHVVAWHDGGLDTFHSVLKTIPDQKLGVVMLTNSDEGDSVVHQLASAALQLMQAEKSGSSAPALASFSVADSSPVSRQGYQGYYASNIGFIKILKQQGHFRLEINGQSFQLKSQPKGGLSAKFPGIGKVTMVRADISGRKVLIGETNAARQLMGEKIALKPLSAAWRQRLGEYRVINPDAGVPLFDSFRLLIQEGFLIAQLNSPGQAQPSIRVLTPVTDTDAVFAGLGRGLGDTLAVESHDGGELLRYSGFSLRRKTP